MRWLKYSLLSLLVASSAFGQAEQPIYKATPNDHVCLDGRFCSPEVDVNGRFLGAAAPLPSGFWFHAIVATPITALTPIPVITAVATPTGTPASSYFYITDLTVANSHATVDTDVELLDASATPGPGVLWNCPAAHAGGGCVVNFKTPLKSSANATLTCFTVTTGAAVRCSIGGYISSN